ncbi:acyltransferase, partial [Candidatus Parvarchaeota archaeon]|nr:acyltransferase [Candidatus Parvarchaeota archaeon]
MRNLVEHRSCKLNSLAQWHVAKNPLTVCYNFCVMSLCKYMPLLGLKNWVYRNLLGMKVGRGTAISPGTTMDFFFPELIEIGSDTIIGYNTLVLTHE